MYHLTVFTVKAIIYALAGTLAVIFVFNGGEQANKRPGSLSNYEIYKERKEFYYQMTVVVLLASILISTLGIPAQETVSQLLKDIGNKLFGNTYDTDNSVNKNKITGDLDMDF